MLSSKDDDDPCWTVASCAKSEAYAVVRMATIPNGVHGLGKAVQAVIYRSTERPNESQRRCRLLSKSELPMMARTNGGMPMVSTRTVVVVILIFLTGCLSTNIHVKKPIPPKNQNCSVRDISVAELPMLAKDHPYEVLAEGKITNEFFMPGYHGSEKKWFDKLHEEVCKYGGDALVMQNVTGFPSVGNDFSIIRFLSTEKELSDERLELLEKLDMDIEKQKKELEEYQKRNQE